ncbi:MAG TPA: hypothetical protein VGH89_18890 [Pseudonocardia sp.]
MPRPAASVMCSACCRACSIDTRSALYLGMAKPLIALGTEPAQMDVTVLPTPDPDLNLLAI